MSVAACVDERTKTIGGQYTLFEDDALGSVIVYTVPNSNKDLPKIMADRCSPEELYNKNQGLIKGTIFRLNEMCRGYDQDDLEQEGRIALWTAAEQFDPSYGTQFSTYAITLIRRAIMHFVKAPTSKLFGGGRLDVVSIQEMQERVDGTGSSVELIAAPEEMTPTYLSESDEIIEVLLNAADEVSRVKEMKGIKALVMHIQGIDSKTIAKEMGVAQKSYSALVTAGRQALKNNPKLLKYISLIKNEGTESVVASLLGSECTVKFSDAATFDTPRYTVREHLSMFSEILSDDKVAECLLDNIRFGEKVVIVDEDTWTTTRFAFDVDEIRLLAVTNIRSRSTSVSRPVEPEKIDINSPVFGGRYTVEFSDSSSYDCSGHSAYAHLSWVAGIVGDEAVADCLLDMVRYGDEAVILDEDNKTVTRFTFDMDKLQLLSVADIRSEAASLLPA